MNQVEIKILFGRHLSGKHIKDQQMTKGNTPQNGASKTGNPSGKGRGNNSSKGK